MQIKKTLLAGILFCFAILTLQAQQVKFTEYDLPNGLHVILHQDKSAPVVAVTVFYHVGSKNEQLGRTGFAHFFGFFRTAASGATTLCSCFISMHFRGGSGFGTLNLSPVARESLGHPLRGFTIREL